MIHEARTMSGPQIRVPTWKLLGSTLSVDEMRAKANKLKLKYYEPPIMKFCWPLPDRSQSRLFGTDEEKKMKRSMKQQAIKYYRVKLICLMTVLATVPKTVDCQFNHQLSPNLPQQQSQNFSSSDLLHPNLRNHRLFIQPEQQQVSFTPLNSRAAERRFDYPQQVQYQHHTVRPAKLLTEYVANRGQRILKNLVNTTIADLVAQSTNKIINSNRNAQQAMLSGQFPTVGKLYTLLFPTIQPQIVGQTTRFASLSGALGNNQTHHQLPSSSENQGQLMSLSAPYDTRPRASIGARGLRIRGNRVQLADETGEWRSRPTELLNHEHDSRHPNLDHYDQTLEPAALASDGAEVSVRDLDSDAPISQTYEGAELSMVQQANQQHSHDDGQTEIGSGRATKYADSNMLPQEQLRESQTESQFANETSASNNESPEGYTVVNQSDDNKVAMGELQLEEIAAAGNQSAGDGLENQFETVEPHSSSHQPESLPEPQQQIAYVNEDGQTVMSPLGGEQASNLNDTSAYPNLQEKYANNRRNHSTHQADESSFTLHLPSKYDSDAIRMPPEGYYDDYFKPTSASSSQSAPAPTSLQPPPTSATASLLNQDSFSHLHELGQSSVGDQMTHNGYERMEDSTKSEPPVEYVKARQQTAFAITNEGEPHQVEFLANNRSQTVSDDRLLQGSNYELQSISLDQQTQRAPPATYLHHDSGGLDLAPNRTYETVNSDARNNISAAQQQKEDNIQVIIANTSNNARSNEKVIHYTSEGQDIMPGKSPRNNFINKDMNEFPPDQPPPTMQLVHQQRQQVPTPSPPQADHLIVRQTPEHPQLHLSPQPQSVPGNERRQPLLITLDPNNKRPKLSDSANQAPNRPMDEDSEVHDRHNTMQSKKPARQDSADFRSLANIVHDNELLPMHRHQHRLMESTAAAAAVADSGEEELGARQSLDRGDDRRSERRARQRAKFSRQQTVQRPQVTQVNFDPKQLAMKEPTPQPSKRNPLDTVVELPEKVQRLREKQPDKNELMNELLTALDRVKVAIYKLQPLTAKMNAIYRKSVTSNTRDIVMDSNKGTYAKRYPPGDYDDSYDRMHPSEQLVKHGAIQSRKEDEEEMEPRQHEQVKQSVELEGNESAATAVYLPAPKEVLEKHKRELNESRITATFEVDLVAPGRTKLVPDGLGRRSGEGSVGRGQLSLTAGERIRYDDDDDDADDQMLLQDSAAAGSSTSNATLGFFQSRLKAPEELHALGDNATLGPLFGYRITIYQTPESADGDADLMAQNEQYTYQVDGIDRLGSEAVNFTQPTNRSSDNDLLDLSDEDGGPLTDDGEDALATSESSLVESHAAGAGLQDVDSLDNSESKSQKSEEWAGETKNGDEKKRGDKSKKSQSKRKRDEEESKKSREYKKIKHNKGIVSKEKKSMHRDKHIKAHDRGAAKEKALKERTQIEFFEREQIIDDEFEKGKKNTVKAGWQSGHDAKKSMRDGPATVGSGDTMSSGGSHFVRHEPKEGGPHKVDKGVELSAEASKGKKSNKYERKQMEAKGKKFKGWREKGYKIITETEFIDRGSLHDSAYKKRDKGSAQHQKFKKHEASSEGHHGSMQEQHRKSLKKEEKRSKMRENKEKGAKFSGAEKRDKRKRVGATDPEAKKRVTAAASEPEIDHDDQPSNQRRQQHDNAEQDADQGESTIKPVSQPDEANEAQDFRQEDNARKRLATNQQVPRTKPQRSLTSSSTLRPHYARSIETPKLTSSTEAPNNRQVNGSSTGNVTSKEAHKSHESAKASSVEQPVIVKYHLLNETSSDLTTRRNDGQPVVAIQASQPRKNHTTLYDSPHSRNNSTILDIFDNLTGLQINKTKIGTYDLEDHHVIRVSGNGSTNSARASARTGNQTPLVKISNSIAKYLPSFFSQSNSQQQQNSASETSTTTSPSTTSTTTTSTTTTKAPNSSQSPARREFADGRLNRHKSAPANVLLNHNLHSVNHNHYINPIAQNHKSQVSAAPANAYRLSGPMTMTMSSEQGERPATTYAPPNNYITHEQAEAAAQLLQIVQRANQVNHASKNMIGHQPLVSGSNHLHMQMNEHRMRMANPLHQATFLSPSTNAYQSGQSVFDLPQMNFAATTGPSSFSPDQFVDYDQEPQLHRATHSFMAD